MEHSIVRSLAKEVYLSVILPIRLRRVIRSASLFVNYSGNESSTAERIGWETDKIIPFGYFPPPLPGSAFVERHLERVGPFRFLLTGEHTRHRDPLVFVRAIKLLRESHPSLHFEGVVCGSGPLAGELERFISRNNLPVQMKGFVSLPELVHQYMTADCFVAAGRSEPWGIRINDAVQCGCPVIVSEGMGAKKLVSDTDCGYVFQRGSPEDLADKMRRLVLDRDEYLRVAGNMRVAARTCSPGRNAGCLAAAIKKTSVA
ncbi:glycosyltransferase family 4 protein [Mesorhizobium sp. M1005]|uniref:glycosyltransferase family 4 protein n=1 Tax=unclassified Mesorhizobium TaxID=325217 RepID=UPI003336E363